MAGVLEKQLARALDMRLAVFASKAASGSLLQDEMSLRAAAYMASENHYALLLHYVQQG